MYIYIFGVNEMMNLLCTPSTLQTSKLSQVFSLCLILSCTASKEQRPRFKEEEIYWHFMVQREEQMPLEFYLFTLVPTKRVQSYDWTPIIPRIGLQ